MGALRMYSEKEAKELIGRFRDEMVSGGLVGAVAKNAILEFVEWLYKNEFDIVRAYE